MPIYEYECGACGHQFERLVRPSSTPSTEVPACPSCQSQDLRQLLSLFAVSSEGTRQQHREQGRRATFKSHRDEKRAEIEGEIAHHNHDHHQDH